MAEHIRFNVTRIWVHRRYSEALGDIGRCKEITRFGRIFGGLFIVLVLLLINCI